MEVWKKVNLSGFIQDIKNNFVFLNSSSIREVIIENILYTIVSVEVNISIYY